MKAVLNRLKDRSTLAGLSVLIMLFGVPVGAADIVAQAIGAVAAAGAVLMPDSKGE